MSRIRICVVSAKGGTGKSTFAVNLARAYAAMGQRTLLIDLDTYCRSLDMLCGAESSVIYDVSDVLSSGVTVERAAVTLPQSENMLLLPGSNRMGSRIPAVAFEKLISSAESSLDPAVIICDTHVPDASARAALAVCTDTVLMSHPTSVSLRATEACGIMLSGWSAPRVRMVLCPCALTSSPLPLSHMIDTSGVRLLGVIPKDDGLAQAQEQGRLARDISSHNTVCAYRNIALRLYGYTTPLFTDFKGIDRERFLGR